jgi:hypothetical protein
MVKHRKLSKFYSGPLCVRLKLQNAIAMNVMRRNDDAIKTTAGNTKINFRQLVHSEIKLTRSE